MRASGLQSFQVDTRASDRNLTKGGETFRRVSLGTGTDSLSIDQKNPGFALRWTRMIVWQ